MSDATVDGGTDGSAKQRSALGRRGFLAGSLAGVVGSALVRLPTAVAEVPGEDQFLVLGTKNIADGPTELAAGAAFTPTLRVENAFGPALVATGGPEFPGVIANAIKADIAGFSQMRAAAGRFDRIVGATAAYTDTLVAETVTVTGTVTADGAAFTNAIKADIAAFSQARVADGRFGRIVGATAAYTDTLVAKTMTVTGTVVADGLSVVQRSGSNTIGAVSGSGQVGVVGTTTPSITITHGVGVWGTTGLPPINLPYSFSVGVLANATGPEEIALRALNPGGMALEVEGRIRVSSGGKGVVREGERMAVVEDASIRESCHLNVMLGGDTGNRGAVLHYVEVEDGKATIHLLANVRRTTPFTWLCFEIAD